MRSIKNGIMAAMVLSSAAQIWADARPDNPYVSIVERNPFGIKPTPPPPPPQEPAAPVVPPAKVILTGVTSIIGPARAILEVTETEPGKAPNLVKGVAKVGETIASIEVLSIDVEKNTVRIRNGKIETNLVVEFGKASTPSGPTPPAGLPALPQGLVPPHAAAPAAGFTSAAAVPQVISRGGFDAPGRPGSGVGSYGADAPVAPAAAAPSAPPAYAMASSSLGAATSTSTSYGSRGLGGVGTYGSTGGDASGLNRPLRTEPQKNPQATLLNNYIGIEESLYEIKRRGLPPPLMPSTPIAEHAAAAAAAGGN